MGSYGDQHWTTKLPSYSFINLKGLKSEMNLALNEDQNEISFHNWLTFCKENLNPMNLGKSKMKWNKWDWKENALIKISNELKLYSSKGNNFFHLYFYLNTNTNTTLF